MKIRIMSDLHLEWDDRFIPSVDDDESSSVLVLPGDICEFDKDTKLIQFLTAMANRFMSVIYIPGNHEYYNGNISNSFQKIHDKIKHINNLHMLNNSYVTINNINFIGSTLWTSLDKGNPLAIMYVQESIRDYIKILAGPNYIKLRAIDTMGMHIRAVEFLHKTLGNELNGQKNVVVTHHAPTHLSVHERYKGDILNSAFYSDLSGLIAQHDPILWVHGHMHNSFDYTVYNTRVICNPKGYPTSAGTVVKYENTTFDDLLCVNI